MTRDRESEIIKKMLDGTATEYEKYELQGIISDRRREFLSQLPMTRPGDTLHDF